MLQEGSLLPQMLLPDVPVNINGFTPQNFSLQFEGAVPASEALARSLNIPAVTMLQRYGVPKFHHMLQQMGFKTINRSAAHYGLSLILGGAEATLWDVTNAYAQMGRILSTTGNRRKDSFGKRWFKKSYFRKDHFKKNNFEKGYIRRSYFRRSHFGRSGLAHPFRLNRSQPP